METHLQALCSDLAGHLDVRVLVANHGKGTTREVIGGVHVTRLHPLGSFRSATICPDMPRAIRESDADLIHMHWPNPSAVLSLAASGYRGPVVVTYHSDVVRQKILGALFEPILHRFLDRCVSIICTSPEYAESSPVLARHQARCTVLPFTNGPVSEHDDAKAVAAIRARYGPRMVLAAGRLVGYKGFIHLVRAMVEVNARLVLVGTGPLRGELEAECRRLSLEGKIDILGEVPDLGPYYAAADVFVLPSVTRAEAFGLVQLEAMAHGKPVVNTALGTGTTHVAPHDVASLTVQPADPGALAAAINRLLDSPELASRLGAGGRSRLDSQFTLQRMTDATIALYDRVLAQPPLAASPSD